MRGYILTDRKGGVARVNQSIYKEPLDEAFRDLTFLMYRGSLVPLPLIPFFRGLGKLQLLLDIGLIEGA